MSGLGLRARRFLARIIDGILAGSLYAMLRAFGHALMLGQGTPEEVIPEWVYPALSAFFVPITEAARGRSFGKQFMELQVYSERGSQYETVKGKFFATFLRDLPFFLPPLVLVDLALFFLRKDARRLGDLMAFTRVARHPDEMGDG